MSRQAIFSDSEITFQNVSLKANKTFPHHKSAFPIINQTVSLGANITNQTTKPTTKSIERNSIESNEKYIVF